MLLTTDKWRCELNDRVTPVVGPAVEPGLEQGTGEEAAIARANDTEYGLAASIWTNHHARALRVSAAMDAGRSG